MKHSLWYKGLKTKAQKDERRKSLSSYKSAFDELEELMNTLRKKPACRNYTSAGWMQEQIAVNEYNSAIDEILTLMK